MLKNNSNIFSIITIKTILFIIVFFPIITLSQEQYRFTNISTENGLSNNYIRFIYQDSYGYLWIGTNEGLNKYDGTNILILKKELPSNFTTSICETNDKKIWIGSIAGISIYNPILNNTDFLDPKIPFANQNIFCIVKSSANSFLISAQSGVYSINTKTLQYKKIQISNEHIKQITQAPDGILFANTGKKIIQYNEKTKTSKIIFSLQQTSDKLLLYNFHNNNLYFSSDFNGLYTYSTLTKKSKLYSNNDLKNINSIAFRNNYLWVGTKNGIIILDSLFNKKEIIKNTNDNYSFKGKNVLALFVDNQNNMWCGMEYNGVNIFYNSQNKFLHYYHDFNESKSLPDNQVNTILELNPNKFLIGSASGLIIFNVKNQEFERIPNFNKEISTLIRTQENEILIGTKEGLFTINETNFKIKKLTTIPNIAIYKIFPDSNNIVWLGTWEYGLIRYNLKTNNVTYFPITKSNKENAVYDINLRFNNELWLATFGEGIIKITDRFNEKPKFKYYKHDFNNPNSLPTDEALSIFKTHDNELWFGIAGLGIYIFNDKKETFTKLKNSDNIDFDCAVQFYEDNDKNVWFNNSGITVYNRTTHKSRSYGLEDGIQNKYFNMSAGCKSSNGNILMGGINGFNYFNPQNVKKINKSNCIPIISNLLLFNKEIIPNTKYDGIIILNSAIAFTDKIEFSYKHSMIQFNLSALHVKNPNALLFSYQMEGYNNLWINLNKNQQTISLSNMNPGTYTLKIRCTDESGKWSKFEKHLIIKINPPFWKTTWFYLIIIICLITIIYIYIKSREFKLIEEKKILEQKVEERTLEINRQKEELKLQSDLLLINNNELLRKNQLITDSITYAKRIQDAILPSIEILKRHIPESFILFKPKDIVSGDFYWFSEQNDNLYIAVSDCTGHGVPGAFMSMIGSTLLNEITTERQNQTPSEILNKLNKGVVYSLNQNINGSSESQDDGMDITICLINKIKKTIQISCANHIVFHIYDNKIEAIEGDIFSIGGLFSATEKKGYSNHEYTYKNGSRFYMFSDGFHDQFGGINNKKYLISQFKELLFKSRNLSMKEQHELLESTFTEWKGHNKQIDDVLVIGIELA